MGRCRRRIAEEARTLIALWVITSLAAAPGCSREGAPPAAVPEAAAPAAPQPTPAPAAPAPDVKVASDDTKAMVAPIALYPDPVLELVLQGATQPGQIVLAARFIDAHAKDPSLAPDEGWDTAVVGLLNYPRVLGMMNDSLDWTSDLGESVAADLDGVQLAVQELRWSAYNTGILASNEWQDVVVTGGVVAIVPAKRDQLSIPEYDGAALLDAATATAPPPADAGTAAAPAAIPPTTAAAAPAAVPVSYSEPQSSFWTNAAIFAGGAALGGLIGYMIGDDDDDDSDDDSDDHYDYYEDRDYDSEVNIENNVVITPARPGAPLRPNRPITRPVTRPGQIGRPGSALPRAVAAGSPGTGLPGRSQVAGSGVRPRGPAGVAPARPTVRPASAGREVAMPRPADATARPASARRDVDGAQRKAAKQARAPERAGELASGRSNPQVQKDRARGSSSRQHAKAAQQPSKKKERSALSKSGKGGGKKDSKADKRGKKSRGRD